MASTSEKAGLLCSLPYGNLWPRRLVRFSVSIFSSMAKWRKEEERGREEMGREGGTGAEGRDGEEKGREGKGGEQCGPSSPCLDSGRDYAKRRELSDVSEQRLTARNSSLSVAGPACGLSSPCLGKPGYNDSHMLWS